MIIYYAVNKKEPGRWLREIKSDLATVLLELRELQARWTAQKEDRSHNKTENVSIKEWIDKLFGDARVDRPFDDNAWWLFGYVVRHEGESAIPSDLWLFWRHIQTRFRPS